MSRKVLAQRALLALAGGMLLVGVWQLLRSGPVAPPPSVVSEPLSGGPWPNRPSATVADSPSAWPRNKPLAAVEVVLASLIRPTSQEGGGPALVWNDDPPTELDEPQVPASTEASQNGFVAEYPQQPAVAPAAPAAAIDVAPAGPDEPKAADLATARGLPTALKERSAQLESLAAEADRHSRRAFELAGRRAFFAARAEFVVALRILAQGLDAEQQTRIHGAALAAGLTALEEVDDFSVPAGRFEADLDFQTIVRNHRTPVLAESSFASLTSLDATRAYLTFAQEQLGAAAGDEVAGSIALRGLGKIHAEWALGPKQIELPEAKAVVCYQAALTVWPQNHLASNDFGVLLARAGRWEDARMAFEHSLSIQRHPAGWQNLAKVYRQLGRHDLAVRAERLASSQRRPASVAGVRWLEPQGFAALAGPAQAAPPARQAKAANGPTVRLPGMR